MISRLKMVGAVAFLMVFGAYHTACFLQYRDLPPQFTPSTYTGKNVFWFARWKMFTGLARYHTAAEFQGKFFDPNTQVVSDWTFLPMDEWYPARWESGYRWERPAVYNRPNVQVKFLEVACERSGATTVRMLKHRWKATLGQREQPKKKYKIEELGVLDCRRRSSPAKGVRL